MKENIVIIGGGIAGMEAAGQLLALGYSPIIIEKSDHLGGHVADWNCLFPDMTPAKDVIDALAAKCSNANIFLNTEISFINRLKDSYNIMLSNGISIVTRIMLITTGFSLFDASKKEEYGYGIYDQVITNKDLEHWFNTGNDRRIDDSQMNAIGFVHCVGSRDEKARNPQCSKVCCITAVKQAIEMKQKFPNAMVYCFYMDLRMFGKKFEDFYISAQRDYGVRFIRGRISEVGENIEGKVVVKTEDTLAGKPVKVTLDLLVLMSGMVCGSDSMKIANMIPVPVDSDGFLKSRDNVSGIIESPKDGIFFAGACTGPKTVPESLAEARAAALKIHLFHKREIMDFGFKIAPSSAINLDNVDLEKFERLHGIEPDVYKCMACGSCSATCPAARFSGMSLRKVILALQRGKEKDAVSMLRNCMLCGKCTMVCPRGINTRHLILSICKIYGGEEK